jgi:hypothetical protein
VSAFEGFVNPVLDRLHSSDVSATVRDGNNHEPMLITANIQTFLAEWAALPCRHSADAKRRVGYHRALAGRCAR